MTSTYDYRNRVYSAALGRFLQTDPIRFGAGDVNLYRYVVNATTKWVDSFGNALIDPGSANCMGHALGESGAAEMSGFHSMQDEMEGMRGFGCKEINFSGECQCDEGEEKVIITITHYGDNPDGRDPWSDPWISSPTNNDIHAVVKGCGATHFSEVMGNHPKNSPGALPKSVSDEEMRRRDGMPNFGMYCCCKPCESK